MPRVRIDEWTSGPVDRSGMAKYVHLIRAEDDPERAPRDGSDRVAAWRRKLMKQPVEELTAEIGKHLADGAPRTFNRIAVEMLDKTADTVFETPFDDALWLLVARGAVEHTLLAPVRFRARHAP